MIDNKNNKKNLQSYINPIYNYIIPMANGQVLYNVFVV